MNTKYFPISFYRGLFYKSSLDCLLKTVHEEGFMALYKGFVPIWTRMVILNSLTYLSVLCIKNIAVTNFFRSILFVYNKEKI